MANNEDLWDDLSDSELISVVENGNVFRDATVVAIICKIIKNYGILSGR